MVCINSTLLDHHYAGNVAFMSEEQTKRQTRSRQLRRIGKWAARIVGLIVLAALGGITATWVHFWDFNVANPSSESCANCHTMDDYVDSLADSSLLVSLHTARNIGCVDCHDYDLEDQLRDTLAFLQDDYDQPFMRARYDNDYCFQCHEHGSYEELKQLIQYMVGDVLGDLHNSHLGEIDCRLCHKMHKPSVDYCSQCHGHIVDKEGWIPWEEPSESP